MNCNFYTINDDDEGEAFSQINFRDDSDNDDSDNDDNIDEHTESELRIRTVTSTSTDDNDNDNDKKNTTKKALDIDYGIADQLDVDKELDLIDELVRIATGSGETETTEYDRIQSRAVHVVHTVGKSNTDSGTANALNLHLPETSLNDSNDDDDDDDIVVDQRKLRKESIMYLYDEEEQLELIDIHDDVNDIITTKDEYDGESGGIGCGGCTTGCTKSAKRRMQRGTILYYLSISLLIGLIIILSGVLYKYNTTGISNSNGSSSISEVNESSESQVIDIKPYDNSMDVPLDEVQQPPTPSFDTTLAGKNNDTVTVPETSTLSPTDYNTNNDNSSKTSSPTGDTTVDSTTYWWDTNNNGIYDEWEMNVEKQDTNDYNSDSDVDSDSAATIPPTSADTIPATIPPGDTSTETPTTYWWDTNNNGIYEEWEMDIEKEDTNTSDIDINSDSDIDTASAATIPATSADTDSTATDVPSTHWYDTTETELPTDGSNTDVPTSRITTPGEEQDEDPINTGSKSNYSNDVIVVDVDTINVVPKTTSRERSGKSGEAGNGDEIRRRQRRTLRTGLRNKVSLTAPVDNGAFFDYVEEENAYANENEELVSSSDAPSSTAAPSSITSSLSSPSPSEASTQSPTSEAPTPSPTYLPTMYDENEDIDEDGDENSDSTTNPTTHWWDNDDSEDGEEDGFTSESIVPTTPWWE